MASNPPEPAAAAEAGSPSASAAAPGPAEGPVSAGDDAPAAATSAAADEAVFSGAESAGAGSAIEPDSATDDEGYAESTTTSYLTSIASDIRRGIEENGRTYAAHGIHKPYMPIDDREMDRNDLQHYKFFLLMDSQLFLAPVGDEPKAILDMGTGSGIWAIDVADQFPAAEVIGVDTAPVQPTMLPPNLVFEVDDLEHDWLWPEGKFDLIHGRELIMAIHDWPRLVRQAKSRLRPGGYLQLCGSYPEFRSDDGTLSTDSAYYELGQIYFEMSDRIGASGREVLRWKEYLEAEGYEDVVERCLKIPTNPWPRDPMLKKIGALELSHFRDMIENVFARGYTQILGGDPAYLTVRLAQARKEVGDRSMHSWVPFYVVYGRKPSDPSAPGAA